MNVLFVQPRYFEPGRRTVWHCAMPSVGLASLAAGARNLGHRVTYLDMEALDLSLEQLPGELRRAYGSGRPDVVAVRATTPLIGKAGRIVALAKQMYPGCLSVIGGPHATVLPDSVFAEAPQVDYVFRGEADETFPRFLGAVARAEPITPGSIPGLCLARDGAPHIAPEVPRVEDLDAVPFPAYDLLPLRRYHDSLSERGRTFMVMTSRGCPYYCDFCAEPVVYGRRVRYRSPRNVVDELELLVRRYGMTYVMFHDSTFNADRERVLKICDLILRRDLKLTWRCKVRVDLVDDELLAAMRRAGCRYLSYGVETASEERLRRLNKGFSISQVRSAFALSRRHGFQILAFFMIGFPDETRAEIDATIRLAVELQPDFVEFMMATPYPGTGLFRQVGGRADSTSWEELYQWRTVIQNRRLAPGELARLYHRAYREFYLRPGYVLRRLRHIRSLADVSFHGRGCYYLLAKLLRR
jgi:radical SAM superfamily enzyme YgiQ (UPF0313 family)